MKTLSRFLVVFPVVSVMWLAPLSAQTYSPLVSLAITLPDGSAQDVNVRDSSVSQFKAKDGTVYEVRATVHDEPFTTATISLFKAATTSDAGSWIADVQAKKGAPAVASKSTPSFKVAVKSIELPAVK